MAEYQYPMAHRIAKPIREYVPSWRQDVDRLRYTFKEAKLLGPKLPKRVNVGTVVHGKLIPPAGASIQSVNVCNEPNKSRSIAEIKA